MGSGDSEVVSVKQVYINNICAGISQSLGQPNSTCVGTGMLIGLRCILHRFGGHWSSPWDKGTFFFLPRVIPAIHTWICTREITGKSLRCLDWRQPAWRGSLDPARSWLQFPGHATHRAALPCSVPPSPPPPSQAPLNFISTGMTYAVSVAAFLGWHCSLHWHSAQFLGADVPYS